MSVAALQHFVYSQNSLLQITGSMLWSQLFRDTRNTGAALILANKDKIIEDVNADVINEGNHNGVFVKDNNVQAQKSHYYLPDRQEQAVW